MGIMMELPDSITYQVPGHEEFVHSLAGHTPEMVVRGLAHGLRQMIIDAASLTRDAAAEMGADAAAEWKRNKRLKAFANREAWLRETPRGSSDDVMWMGEARKYLKILKVGAKTIASLKNTADAKAALLAAAGPIAGETYIRGIDKAVALKRAELANPDAMLAALAALAESDATESETDTE